MTHVRTAVPEKIQIAWRAVYLDVDQLNPQPKADISGYLAFRNGD